ncbi:hypothetical protein AC1031_001320 [Aphanomyces cochlioides]|nr:hypothetical protein AC1031_001320 [Aphanomyces cochlioides]
MACNEAKTGWALLEKGLWWPALLLSSSSPLWNGHEDPKRSLRFDVYLFGARTFVQGRGKFSFKPWRGDQHAALVNSQHRNLQNTRLGCREVAIAEADDFYTHMSEATTGQIDKILQQVPAEDAVPPLSKCASPPKQSRMLSQLMAAWDTEDIAPAAVSLKSQRGQRTN